MAMIMMTMIMMTITKMTINMILTIRTIPSRFRTAMTEAGFTVAGEEHAICPVIIIIMIIIMMLIIIDHGVFDHFDDDLVSGDALG